MSTAIDWPAVQAAARRSKLGHASSADQDLCLRAWKADPKRYSEVSGRGQREAVRSVNPLAEKETK